jgi:hypothetical protein
MFGLIVTLFYQSNYINDSMKLNVLIIGFNLWTIIALSITLQGQNLIPYLGKNGLYGLADSTGRVVLQPSLPEIPESVSNSVNHISVHLKDSTIIFLSDGSKIYSRSKRPFVTDVQLFHRDEHKPIKSIDNLLSICENNGTGQYYGLYTLVNLNSKKIIQIDIGQKSTSAVNWDDRTDRRSQLRFRFGLLKILDGDKVNFINTDLKRIFDESVTSATVANEKYIFVKNQQDKIAIADHNGKFLTTFDWNNLKSVTDPELFITTSDDKCSGVIDVYGKTIIPCTYNGIEEKYGVFILGKDQWQAIFNGKGEILVPYAMQKIKSLPGGNLMIQTDKGYSLIKPTGEVLIKNSKFQFQAITGTKKGIYFVQKNSILDIYNFDGDFIVADTASVAEKLLIGDIPIYKFIGHRHNGKVKFKAYNEDLKPMFDGIWQNEIKECCDKNNAKFIEYENPKTRLRGLVDAMGKEILPPVFESFSGGIEPNNKDVVFAKLPGSYLWQSYSYQGSKTKFDPSLRPEIIDKPVKYITFSKENKNYLVFADETVVPYPNDWGWNPHITYFGLKTDKIIAYEKSEHFELISQTGKNLIPSGFVAQRGYVMRGDLERTGYAVLIQDGSNVIKSEPPKTEELEPNKNINFNETSGVGSGSNSESTNKNDQLYGVINTRGEWVIEPKPGSFFKPLSTNIIGELYIKDAGLYDNSLSKIHIIKDNNIKTIDVTRAVGYDDYSKDPFSVSCKKKTDSNSFIYRDAYFEHNGTQLSDFEFSNGPEVLTKSNLVYRDIEGKPELQIINNMAKTIKRLPNLTAFNMDMRGFAVVRNDKREYGLIDSVGNIAIPFDTIEYLEYYSNVVYKRDAITKEYSLLDKKGDVIVDHLDDKPSVIDLDNGWKIVNVITKINSSNVIYVLDKNIKTRYVLENTRFERLADKTKGRSVYMIVSGIGQKPFYVNIESGKAFIE